MLNPLIKEKKLSHIEYERYSRHLIIEEFNQEGQKRIKAAKVLFVGAGGLSSSALLYLTASGIGEIGIIDHDEIEISNLQRQIIYKINNIKENKAKAAKDNLQYLNPLVNIIAYNDALTEKNAYNIIANYDIVIDGTDNFISRYIISKCCYSLHKIHIYGAIEKFIGQISVFNYQNGPNYYDLYNESSNKRALACSERGVLNTLPAIIGTIQATETIKIVTGIGTIMNGYLLIYNSLDSSLKKIQIKPARLNIAIQKVKKNIHLHNELFKPMYIDKQDIQNLNKNSLYKLVDIREPIEFEIKKIKGSINIPLKKLKKITTIKYIKEQFIENIIIIYCNNELRSYIASQVLHRNHVKHYILKGGLKDNHKL